jgi:signal transduction histidine kinase
MARKSKVRESRFTILVVDDQEEARTSVRQLLEREGHSVLTAECGERAVALFKERQVDLILLDYFMPRMTGEQVVRQIRSLDSFVQIILLTGYSGEKPARVMMADLDIQGYHDKADGPEKLLMWVDVGLKAHRMIDSVRERERLHGELVANVSHEFRTPLNIIAGYTELLLDGEFGELPTAAERPLHSMAEATGSLTELVADFLNYAKIEARAMEVTRQRIPTAELAGEIERLGLLLVEERAVRFSVEGQNAPAVLLTDAVKLRTILRNLVTNAAKFTRTGTIVVRIARSDGTVRFAVTDTGPGIPADDLALIFEPFRQLQDAAVRSRGIGLGLALARKLARILGGDLRVESEVGVGSTFTLVLPDAAVGQVEATGAVTAYASTAPGTVDSLVR